jgi:hypothetical protein
MGREVRVLVDAGAEQPPQLLGSSGYGDARLVRRDLGGAWKPLSVAANFEQLAWRRIGRLIEAKLGQVSAHPEASPRQAVDPGGAIAMRERSASKFYR